MSLSSQYLISKPEDLESAAADLAQRLALYYGTSELIEVLSHTQEGTVRATT